MRCPGCNKFPSFDTSNEPEVDLSVEDSGGAVNVTGTVRIVLTSECCSEECKDATFDVEEDITKAIHAAIVAAAKVAKAGIEKYKTGYDFADLPAGDSIEYEAEGTSEISERSESTKTRTLKNGTVKVTHIPFRYQRRYYGHDTSYTVNADCKIGGKQFKAVYEGHCADDIQASSMDELV